MWRIFQDIFSKPSSSGEPNLTIVEWSLPAKPITSELACPWMIAECDGTSCSVLDLQRFDQTVVTYQDWLTSTNDHRQRLVEESGVEVLGYCNVSSLVFL